MYVQIGRYRDDEAPREEHVVIHKYDTWNMDHTLSLIITPLLKEFKKNITSVPRVHLDHVPQELHPPTRHQHYNFLQKGQKDANYEKRWDYVLDEMIFAFESTANKTIIAEHSERITNGYALFGMYYSYLWC
jgi:hypothetical protein